MTPEAFWLGDPWLAYSYKRAHEFKNQQMSQQMWMQGLYNFHAFSTALSNLHFDGKRHKINQYLDEPIRLLPLTEWEKEEQAEKERKRVVEYFNALAKRWEEDAES